MVSGSGDIGIDWGAEKVEAEKATSTAAPFRLSFSRPGEFKATGSDATFNSVRYKMSKTCETISLPNSLVSLIISNAKPSITIVYIK